MYAIGIAYHAVGFGMIDGSAVGLFGTCIYYEAHAGVGIYLQFVEAAERVPDADIELIPGLRIHTGGVAGEEVLLAVAACTFPLLVRKAVTA